MHLMESAPCARAIIDGREVDYYCGTSYLGLHCNSQIADAVCEAVRQFGTGSAASRSTYGTNAKLLAVEENAAQFFKTEDSIYHVSGYMSNAVLLQGLASQYDVTFVDSASHYSVMDGAAMANKPTYRFESGDSDDLARQLSKQLKPGQRPLLICDGIYPGDGSLAPLKAYNNVLSQYDDFLFCVDDAHASGVIGEQGHGSFEYCGLQGRQYLTARTMSKAFGGYGGLIAGEQKFIDLLNAHSAMLKGATPPPPPVAAATAKALEIAIEKPELRDKLWENVRFVKNAFRELGVENIPNTPVPIISLAPKGVNLRQVQQQLSEQYIEVLYLPPNFYTSVPDSGSLRLSIFADHSRAQLERLVEVFKALI